MNLKKLSGGYVFFSSNAQKPDDQRIYQKYTDTNGIPKYKSLNSPNLTNSFNIKQQSAINDFFNFILPFIKFENKYLGINHPENLEEIGVGTFGLTFAANNVLIKICKLTPASENDILMETAINCMLQTKQSPPQINKFYGYFTSNSNFISKLHEKNKELQHFSPSPSTMAQVESPSPVSLSIPQSPPFAVLDNPFTFTTTLFKYHTNLDDQNDTINFDISRFHERINDMKMDLNIDDNILILLFEKSNPRVSDYLHHVLTMPDVVSPPMTKSQFQFNSIQNIFKFIHDIHFGLSYLHNLGYVHNDLKLDNIVKKVGISNFTYQLIDFGEVRPNLSTELVGTPFYFKNSSFESRRHYLYDYHCLFIIMGILFNMFYDANANTVPKQDVQLKYKTTPYDDSILSDKLVNAPIHSFLNNEGAGALGKINKSLTLYVQTHIDAIYPIVDKAFPSFYRYALSHLILILGMAQFINETTASFTHNISTNIFLVTCNTTTFRCSRTDDDTYKVPPIDTNYTIGNWDDYQSLITKLFKNYDNRLALDAD